MGRLFLVVAGIVSACIVLTLILFVILLMGVDPPPLGKLTGDQAPKGPLRRPKDDLPPFSNLTDTEDGSKGDNLDVDQILDQIVSSSIAQLSNNTTDESDNDVTKLSNSILTRLRGNLLRNIKRAIPRMIQSEEEVDKLQTKINSDITDQSVVRTDDVVAINITDVLGQPLVELKLYSHKSGKTTGEGEMAD